MMPRAAPSHACWSIGPRLLEHRPALAGASARACWSVKPLPSQVYEMLLYGE
ncbi:MAG: hypothetical protein IKO60_03855 [Bacteroidaceae bacterium]|nr:hypothetical protein [Bacteroidaceae bacterium]